jgi:hypothetical protein
MLLHVSDLVNCSGTIVSVAIHNGVYLAFFASSDKQNSAGAHRHRSRTRIIVGIHDHFRAGRQFDEIKMNPLVASCRLAACRPQEQYDMGECRFAKAACRTLTGMQAPSSQINCKFRILLFRCYCDYFFFNCMKHFGQRGFSFLGGCIGNSALVLGPFHPHFSQT